MHKDLRYTDETTKLNNRNYFIKKLQDYLDIYDPSVFGVNILVSLHDVKQSNEKIGYLAINDFLVKLSSILSSHVKDIQNSIVARMNGSDFCLFLPKCQDKKAYNIATKIQNDTDKLICDFDIEDTLSIYIGIYAYNDYNTITTLLKSSNEVLKKAKLSPDKIYQKSLQILKNEEDNLLDIVIKAITNSNFYFISFKAVDTKHKKVLHNRLSISLKCENGKLYRYTQFSNIVEKHNLVDKLYNNLLQTIFQKPDETLRDFVCCIRLPYDYLTKDENYKKFKNILDTYANHLPYKLILEFPNKFISTHIDQAVKYKKLLSSFSIDIGIYEFEKCTNTKNIQAVSPSYIKADATYLISNTPHIQNIPIIATDVKDTKLLDTLQKKDIYLIDSLHNSYIPED